MFEILLMRRHILAFLKDSKYRDAAPKSRILAAVEHFRGK